MKSLINFFFFVAFILSSTFVFALSDHQPTYFNKVIVIIFENMSYNFIKNEPAFRQLVKYTGHDIDENGTLTALPLTSLIKDNHNRHYALFSQYVNNHTGGSSITRPSQPNYVAMISGSIQRIKDNENHDLNSDNLAMELNEAGMTWKVYAEDLPDPVNLTHHFQNSHAYSEAIYDHLIPYQFNPSLSEELNNNLSNQYYQAAYQHLGISPLPIHESNCFLGAKKGDDGYVRKHEPFISFTSIQHNHTECQKIVNAAHFYDELNQLPDVTFYIPNLKNDGHNGTDYLRKKHANALLAKMMGLDPKSGNPLPNDQQSPFQRIMSQHGLVVITFDEPSVISNPRKTIYTLLAGDMIKSGAYPDSHGLQPAICYPPLNRQNTYPADPNGLYDPTHCNHYNLLKMIESNWHLRGLAPQDTSSGYKYAYPLGYGIDQFWP